MAGYKYCPHCGGTLHGRDHACSATGNLYKLEKSRSGGGGDFLLSAVIGAATGSALLGGLLGGSFLGGITGDLLDGDLFD